MIQICSFQNIHEAYIGTLPSAGRKYVHFPLYSTSKTLPDTFRLTASPHLSRHFLNPRTGTTGGPSRLYP